MNLFYKGQPVTFNIDDYLPVDFGNETIAARVSRNGAWWAVLLEKAYAKMHTSYAHMSGGLPYEAMRTLTGMPVSNYRPMLQSNHELWRTIREADKKDYLLTASTDFSSNGLTKDHAYTLLGAAEVTDPDSGKKIKLIKMRNPWDRETYVGPWNDVNSTKWTKETKAALKHTPNKEDGVFYMPLHVFKRAFGRYSVTMYDERWKSSHKKGDGKPGWRWYFHFDNPVDQEVVLTFEAKSPRLYPHGCRKHKQNYNLYVLNENGEKLFHEAAPTNSNYRDAHFEELKAGKYKIKVINFGDEEAPANFMLTSYAMKESLMILDPK